MLTLLCFGLYPIYNSTFYFTCTTDTLFGVPYCLCPHLKQGDVTTNRRSHFLLDRTNLLDILGG
jgi:hypothetical protein